MQKKLKVVYTTKDLAITLNAIKNSGNLGFVPTMGALHKGHISLIEKSISENAFTICSIFVNHKQFNNNEDFEKYPKTIEADLAKLKEAKCDIVFVPTTGEIYPPNFLPKLYTLGNIENILEGFYRPGHFQGVCVVVNRLLDLIMPAKMYLGLKDYQQCKVIQKMLQIQSLANKVELCLASTVRDERGLALSSRNLRLSAGAKIKALILISCLEKAKEKIVQQRFYINLTDLQTQLSQEILKAGFEAVDYFEFVNEKFEIITNANEAENTITILTAATIEGIRLIDNIEIKINEYAK